MQGKIGIGRFTNETRYGAGVFLGLVQTDDGYDRIGKQASDILISELTKSQKFILLERTDLNKLKAESKLMGLSPEDFSKNLVGVDALILGSVSEFGRKDESDVGFFGRSRKQVAHAKVNIRLVDPRTGYVFFSEDGAADAIGLEERRRHGPAGVGAPDGDAAETGLQSSQPTYRRRRLRPLR